MALRWSPTSSSLTFPSIRKPQASSLTPLEALNLAYAAQHMKNSGGTFWDSVKHDTGGALSFVLDKLMRPNYAIAEGTREAHAGGSFLHGAKEGILGHEHTTFGDVLKEEGLLKHHNILRGLAGFGLDVATDPLSYVTAGAGDVAEQGVKGIARVAGKKFVDGTFEAATPEEAAAHLPHAEQAFHQVVTGGSGFEQRKALGVMTLKNLQKVAGGDELTGAEHFNTDLFRAGALAEESASAKKALKVGIGDKSVTLSAKGKRIVPLPSKVLKGKTSVGKFIGKAFVPGFGNEVMHRALMVGRHGAERLASEHMQHINRAFQGIEKLPMSEQLDALERFEAKGGVIPHGKGYVLNPERFEGLSPAQQQFVRAWHSSTEYLRKADEEFGIKYKSPHTSAKGQLYIPHIVDRAGDLNRKQIASKLNSVPGFTQARRGQGTVAELRALHESGKAPKDLIADPFELLARRARASANAQADHSVVEVLKKTMGTPGVIVDHAKLSAAKRELDAAKAAHAAIVPKTSLEMTSLSSQIKAGLIHSVDQTQAQKFDALNASFRRVKYGRKSRTKAATLARLQKAIDAHPDKAHKQFESLAAGTHPAYNKAMRGHISQNEALLMQKKQAAKAVKVAQKEFDKVAKGARNPEAKNARAAGWVKPTGFDHYFPPNVANAIERSVRVYKGDDEATQALTSAYRKYLAKWKLAVTSINPGYRLRNTLSDFWNMYVAGVPLHAIPRYGAKAAEMMKDAKSASDKIAAGLEKTLTANEKAATLEMMSAYNHGVLSGLFQGDVQQVKRFLEHGSKKGLIQDKKFLALGAKVAQDMNRNAENWGRLTHYLYRRQAQGMSIARSAREVRAAHFDYEDLTPFERERLKLIAPFYTWTRKNIPFQLQALATRPGKWATFPKFAIESEKAAGGGKGDILPGYLKDQMAFKTPLGYLLPQIGAADLAGLASPAGAKSHFLPMLTPALKVPYEVINNQRFGTDQKIHGDYDRNPVSGGAAAVLGAIPGNPLNVGRTARGGIKGVGANPWVGYIAGQTPLSNLLVNQGSSIKKQQRGAFGSDIAYLSGLNFQDVNQDSELLFAQIAFRDYVKKQDKNLRAEGILPPSKVHKKTKYDSLVAQLLKQKQGR